MFLRTLVRLPGTVVQRLHPVIMREGTSTQSELLQEFHRHCQSLAANQSTGYRLEFERLNDVGVEFSTKAGELEANRGKNRYPCILPYDHCRVKLTAQDSKEQSDYINASYVPGNTSDRDFICTQGPLQSTLAEFWRMVWENNVHVVVMVTDLRENDRVLCEQYWPQERSSAHYGPMHVTTLHQQHCGTFFITTIALRQVGSSTERKITHYYNPDWPDRGVPRDCASFCSFTDHVRQCLNDIPSNSPTIVHCSAGVGRSGTFVALLCLFQLCARGIRPDVRRAVHSLRRHRMMMVQTLEQYIFIHSCLLHSMSEGSASKPRAKQSSRRKTGDKGVTQASQSSKKERRSKSAKQHGAAPTATPTATPDPVYIPHRRLLLGPPPP